MEYNNIESPQSKQIYGTCILTTKQYFDIIPSRNTVPKLHMLLNKQPLSLKFAKLMCRI